jgi:uncharacterized protein
MAKNTCGTCTMCCKIMGVPDMEPEPKQAHKWCQHCLIGKGCGIYDARPSSCREFECLWLKDTRGIFKPEDRPDKTGVVLQVVAQGVIAQCEPSRPTAWRGEKVLPYLKGLARGGRPVSATTGKRFWIITGTAEWEAPPELVQWTPGGFPIVTVPNEIKQKIGLWVKPEFYPPGMRG